MPSTNKYCRFYLTRHGETEWNVQHIMQGQQDSPLTKNGIDQAKTTAKKLSDVKFDHVFSSDLLRAQRTAQIIAADQDLTLKTTALLREINLGPFTGKKLSYFRNRLKKSIAYRETLSNEKQLSYKIHPQVESYEEIGNRVISFLKKVALAYPGGNILVVSHAGTIRATLLILGFASPKELPHEAVTNASYAVIDSDGIDFFLRETEGIEMVED